MADTSEIVAARRALGHQLAAFRQAAGYNQRQFAPLTHYGRSTIANVEVGRQNVPRSFWERVDAVLGAGGNLLHRYDQLHALVQRHLEEAAQLAISDREDYPHPSLVAEFSTSSQVDALITHLREQWHLLVKTDNLLGPRHAVSGVLDQLAIIKELLRVTRDDTRRQGARLAAQYAESAAWLHEDAGDLPTAHYWTGRAMEWAHQAQDPLMLAWSLFRRSQQSLTEHDPGQAVGLIQAAHRPGSQLPKPMRAAMFQQEALAVALDGNEPASQRLIDTAHDWAVPDASGDAHQGHGSFCTPNYLEVQRARCWLATGRPKRAIAAYEIALTDMPTVYHRDRGMALAGLATAYTATSEPDRAATLASEALRIGRAAGSRRTESMVTAVGQTLTPHRTAPAVAMLLGQIAQAG